MKMLKKILHVFTKEYRDETRYMEFMEQNVDKFKLRNDGRKDFLDGIQNHNLENNFHIDINFEREHNETNIGKEPGE